MRRNLSWVSEMLALTLPALAVAQGPDGQSPERPASPKERFAAIVQAQEEARLRYRREKADAKDEVEVDKVLDRYCAEGGKHAREALDLVQANPHDPVAVDILRFIILTEKIGHRSNAPEGAMEILSRDHIRDTGMGELCLQIVPFFEFPVTESLIRNVLEKNPNREERGRAGYALAMYLRRRAGMKKWLQEKGPEIIKNWEEARGKEAIARLFRQDSDVLEEEADALLDRVLSEFGSVRNVDDQRTLADVVSGELFARGNLVIGKPAPEIEGQDQEGKTFRLSDYRGKVVVLTFSGNWCGPCRGMYPEERELVRAMKDEPFALLSVNTDEDREVLRKSITSGEVTWRCWWDGGIDGPITTRWGVRSFPTMYVLDSEGIIRFKPRRGEALDKLVESLLKANPTAAPQP